MATWTIKNHNHKFKISGAYHVHAENPNSINKISAVNGLNRKPSDHSAV